MTSNINLKEKYQTKLHKLKPKKNESNDNDKIKNK